MKWALSAALLTAAVASAPDHPSYPSVNATPTTTQPPVSATCPYPEVQNCYVVDPDACWTPFQQKNAATLAALNALPDQGVAAGVSKLLLDGSEFKEVWSVATTDDGKVHLTAYRFEEDGYAADLHYAQVTIQLNAASDATYATAAEKLSDQFDGVFYSSCVAPVLRSDNSVYV
eukprot:NODE_23431_length_666_cov_6.866419.p1 GENE.NODE_23431_length_666_cov_6.866419~~NODE_23431_length_666_cov_6.866419.p1  ORF type:complete len:174 (+),score=41.39 NODE_23431_length_666_cov_6.866419:72-593(+)